MSENVEMAGTCLQYQLEKKNALNTFKPGGPLSVGWVYFLLAPRT